MLLRLSACSSKFGRDHIDLQLKINLSAVYGPGEHLNLLLTLFPVKTLKRDSSFIYSQAMKLMLIGCSYCMWKKVIFVTLWRLKLLLSLFGCIHLNKWRYLCTDGIAFFL